MADQEKDKRMDEMLDSLLANCSSAEPRQGLETRILANLRDVAQKEDLHGRWNFRWLWVGTVAAAIIIAAGLMNGRHRVEPPSNIIVKNSQPVMQPEIRPSFTASGGKIANIRRRKPSAPTLQKTATLTLNQRPAIFPTPTPLSEQEQLLFKYFTNTPREEVVAQSHPDEPPVNDRDESGIAIPDLVHVPQKSSNTR
ncbi:MAG TPA: hypothetical protein VN872_00950 [Candidatus Acidoferrum sp.]|nr:hypothetical protein [Candidatus Acidoferrum sp.]